jgi:hypothetical protein
MEIDGEDDQQAHAWTVSMTWRQMGEDDMDPKLR